jgi:hypothetical protein
MLTGYFLGCLKSWFNRDAQGSPDRRAERG